MMTQLYFIYLYCDIIVLVLGIIGNILVIISILRQKKLLRNSYYVLVFQLAINDLAVLIIYFLHDISEFTLEKSLYDHFLAYRIYYFIYFLFQVAGIGMMLFISVVRYHAAIHPLKPSLSRRKVKNVVHMKCVHIWPHCRLWTSYVIIFYPCERYSDNLRKILLYICNILLLHFSNIFYEHRILQNMPRTYPAEQTHEKPVFKSFETKDT